MGEPLKAPELAQSHWGMLSGVGGSWALPGIYLGATPYPGLSQVVRVGIAWWPMRQTQPNPGCTEHPECPAARRHPLGRPGLTSSQHQGFCCHGMPSPQLPGPAGLSPSMQSPGRPWVPCTRKKPTEGAGGCLHLQAHCSHPDTQPTAGSGSAAESRGPHAVAPSRRQVPGPTGPPRHRGCPLGVGLQSKGARTCSAGLSNRAS